MYFGCLILVEMHTVCLHSGCCFLKRILPTEHFYKPNRNVILIYRGLLRTVVDYLIIIQTDSASIIMVFPNNGAATN